MVPRPATAPEIMPSTDGLRRVAHSIARPGQRAGAGGKMRRRDRHHRARIGAKRRAAIEAEPADPQHAGADHREREVVRRQVLGAVALALAEHLCRDQAADAGGQMHHEAAGEIEHAHGGEEAAAPDPMRQRHIDER